MFIKRLKLNSFRCFDNKQFDFEKKIIVIEGNNGTGKTSILEALYYICYLRSFRTRQKKELLNFDKKHFFISVDFNEKVADCDSNIQIGFSEDDGRLVKFNKTEVSSYKDIISHYKVISLTENDLQLIIGAPEFRRSFLNQSLFLRDPSINKIIKEYKQFLQQRNSFILKNYNKKTSSIVIDELMSWTKKLWERSVALQKLRIDFLNSVEEEVNLLLASYFFKDKDFVYVKIKYLAKNLALKDDFSSFWEKCRKELLEKEFNCGRSLFGIHLDDFSIIFKKKSARVFASRGQQKLILLLLKVAQLKKVFRFSGEEPGILLLDDFLTDFDSFKLESSFNFLNDLESQVFITCPIKSFIFNSLGVQKMKKDIHFLNL